MRNGRFRPRTGAFDQEPDARRRCWATRTGGSIGVWHFLPEPRQVCRSVERDGRVVGVDYVGIGTDQHVSPESVQDYRQWVHLVAAMLRGGFTAEEAGKIAGGNYLRIFLAAVG